MTTVKAYEVVGGWGYDILNEDGSVAVSQPFNPADGFNPFGTKEEAEAHANKVLNPE